MVNQSIFTGWLLAWLLCLAFVLYGQRKERMGAGLVISYVLQLWVIHWLAAGIYALPWYFPPDTTMTLGLQQSTYAIAGFAIGSTILLPLLSQVRQNPYTERLQNYSIEPWLVRACLLIGVVTYFVLEPILHRIPTIGAIASASSSLLLAALAMECWNGLQHVDGKRSGFWRWVIAAAALPFITIVTKGFLGYGFVSMLTIFAFVASAYRPRWKLVLGSAAIGYLALSLYVTYMRDRSEIRDVVWSGEAYSSRFSTVSGTLTQFEFLDLTNIDHLSRIDERLNQNYLLGMAVEFLDTQPDRFADGRTIWEAMLSPIPRSLWPDKPMVAGSGDLVSEFTGMHFDEETSVGIGHIMEWYVNFGTPGVIFGMMFLGVVIAWIDRRAAAHLYRGDGAGFVLYWLPGVSMLQVGGSLVDTVSSAGAGLVVGVIIYRFRLSRMRRRPGEVLRKEPLHPFVVDPR